MTFDELHQLDDAALAEHLATAERHLVEAALSLNQAKDNLLTAELDMEGAAIDVTFARAETSRRASGYYDKPSEVTDESTASGLRWATPAEVGIDVSGILDEDMWSATVTPIYADDEDGDALIVTAGGRIWVHHPGPARTWHGTTTPAPAPGRWSWKVPLAVEAGDLLLVEHLGRTYRHTVTDPVPGQWVTFTGDHTPPPGWTLDPAS